jgi:hypothetical protein
VVSVRFNEDNEEGQLIDTDFSGSEKTDPELPEEIKQRLNPEANLVSNNPDPE